MAEPALNLPNIEPQPTGYILPAQTHTAAARAVLQRTHSLRDHAYRVSKRALDIAASLLVLSLGSPVFLAIAVLIRVTSDGPILYRHTRLGLGGRSFCCYKFRTMVDGADGQIESSVELRREFEENFKILNDPRVTGFGSILRKCSLDELPQFWNVLIGDMSLIGPRPIVPPEITKYGTHAAALISVPAGISGLWQACGRSCTSYEERVQMDMMYVEHRSLLLDLTLVARTVWVVIKRVGAC